MTFDAKEAISDNASTPDTTIWPDIYMNTPLLPTLVIFDA